MAFKMSRKAYSDLYGPTEGDRIHLADTKLIIEIKKDCSKGQYGDENVSGGGKSFRDGMAQMAGAASEDGILDLVLTDAVIMDPVLGIIKGDLGVKDGKIVGIGKSGNPHTMQITPGLATGAGTEVVALEGHILTAGGIDVHIHFESPDQVWEALANGITTMIGGGTGSKTLGIETPGPWHLRQMIQAHENLPVNAGFLGRGNSSLPASIREQALGGAVGMKVHEDYGATPQVIKTCLDVADELDFQVQLHSDTLNEGGFVEETIKAIGGRTLHAYHTEGAGGGHAPDIMRVCGEKNIIPSSTNPTNPYTVNTIAEHLQMIMAAHNLNPRVPEDVAFADSRIRGETIAAEDVFHDMGAISIISSDSQGMGRVGESVLRAWQLASKMKQQRGALPEDEAGNDNERVLRYLAKYTINPALAMGIADYTGSLEPGKIADMVVWDPRYFGAKARMVFKSGALVYSYTGDVNASIEWSQPIVYRKQYGALGANGSEYCKIFVTQAALDHGLREAIPGSAEKFLPVRNTRSLKKSDMVRNGACPRIEIDPETYKVYADGVLLTCEPAAVLPLAQKYFFR